VITRRICIIISGDLCIYVLCIRAKTEDSSACIVHNDTIDSGERASVTRGAYELWTRDRRQTIPFLPGIAEVKRKGTASISLAVMEQINLQGDSYRDESN